MSSSTTYIEADDFGQHADLRWTISHLKSDNILWFKIQGVVTAQSFSFLIQAQREAALAFNCTCYLMDFRESDFRLNTLETYMVPQELAAAKVPTQRITAVVFSHETEQTNFLENRFRNAGVPAVVFYDLEAAKSWLYTTKEKTPSIFTGNSYLTSQPFYRPQVLMSSILASNLLDSALAIV